MESSSSTPEQAFLAELRRHRAELRESMSALEDALAAPATTDRARWAERVHVALVELSGDFREHVDITEGPGGLYRDLLETAPRLSDAVAGLTQEHVLVSRLAVFELSWVLRGHGVLANPLLSTITATTRVPCGM